MEDVIAYAQNSNCSAAAEKYWNGTLKTDFIYEKQVILCLLINSVFVNYNWLMMIFLNFNYFIIY